MAWVRAALVGAAKAAKPPSSMATSRFFAFNGWLSRYRCSGERSRNISLESGNGRPIASP